MRIRVLVAIITLLLALFAEYFAHASDGVYMIEYLEVEPEQVVQVWDRLPELETKWAVPNEVIIGNVRYDIVEIREREEIILDSSDK